MPIETVRPGRLGPAGRYLGVITSTLDRVAMYSRPSGEPGMAAYGEIRPSTPKETRPMPTIPFQPGDHIRKPAGRYLGVITAISGDDVRYEHPDGLIGGGVSRRQIRRATTEQVAANTTAEPARSNGAGITARSPQDARQKARGHRIRDLREGSYQFGAATVIAAVEPDRRHTGRIGNVVRVTAAGREVEVRLTPAGKNATITVDGQPVTRQEDTA